MLTENLLDDLYEAENIARGFIESNMPRTAMERQADRLLSLLRRIRMKIDQGADNEA